MNQGDVTIIIPAFGPAGLVDSCVISILQTCSPAQTIVWDNGVDHGDYLDGSVRKDSRLLDQALERNADTKRAMKGVWNLGFASGCNYAANSANSDLLLFLNCDTEPQEGWLDPLIAAFDDPTVGIAGSRLVWPDGEIQHAGVLVNLEGGAWAMAVGNDWSSREVDAVTGACLMIRRSLFQELGGFDTRFWNCFEDVDLNLRARLAGYRVVYVRESLVMHHHKATGSERWALAYPNIIAFSERWTDATVPLAPDTDELREKIKAAKSPHDVPEIVVPSAR